MYPIIAQSIGVIAMCFVFFIYTAKNRKTLITLKFTADLLWAIHYFMIGAFPGAVMNIINMGRETVFQLKSTKKWAQSRIWVVVFIIVSLTSAVLSWQGPCSILPAAGSSIAVIGLWCADPMYIRLFNLPGVSLWLIYAIITKSPSSTINNIIALASICFGLYRDIRDRKKA